MEHGTWREMRSHNKIPSTYRRSEMKQRKKITRVPNMQNIKQKRQKVNPQMSRQRNTDNSVVYLACGLKDLKTE
jgi:hypothetical protein